MSLLITQINIYSFNRFDTIVLVSFDRKPNPNMDFVQQFDNPFTANLSYRLLFDNDSYHLISTRICRTMFSRRSFNLTLTVCVVLSVLLLVEMAKADHLSKLAMLAIIFCTGCPKQQQSMVVPIPVYLGHHGHEED